MIVLLKHGLGNQMFQYAFAYALSRAYGQAVKLDAGWYELSNFREYVLDAFDIQLPLASKEEIKELRYKKRTLLEKVIRKILPRGKRPPRKFSGNDYLEPHFHFDPHVFSVDGDRYFDGYWQSEKYFKEYRNELLCHLSLKKDLHPQSRVYESKIMATESVGLHVRRGDYVSVPSAIFNHGTCPVEYYQKAMDRIKASGIDNPSCFVFSDDLEWAKNNLAFLDSASFVELDEDVPDYEEMVLMSRCRHNIIANSSFSWWGAWLNQNPDKMVIAPAEWFDNDLFDAKNLVPEDWIRM